MSSPAHRVLVELPESYSENTPTNEELNLMNQDDEIETLRYQIETGSEDPKSDSSNVPTEEIVSDCLGTIAPVTSIPCTYTIGDSNYQPLHTMMFYDNQNHNVHNQPHPHLYSGNEHPYWDTDHFVQMSSMTVPISDSSQYFTQQHQIHPNRIETHQSPHMSVAILPPNQFEENQDQQNADRHNNDSKSLNQTFSRSSPVMSDIENANDLVESQTCKRKRRRRRKRSTTTLLEHWSASSWRESSSSPTLVNRALHNEIERRRRHRIKECCDALKELVPGLSDKTDKATVLEQTVRFVKHSFDCPNKCTCGSMN